MDESESFNKNGVFRSTDGRNAVLEIGGHSIPGYILVDPGPNNAVAMYMAARKCRGVADSYPPLPCGYLAFRVPRTTTLKAYLTDPNFTSDLLSPAGVAKSRVKLIVSALGRTLLQASSHNIKLDLEWENIYVDGSYPEYPYVTTIPMPGVVEEDDWANDLRQLYEKIKDTLPTYNDPELDHFIADVATSPSLRSAHFDSHIFWYDQKRESVLRYFGYHAKQTPFMFHRVPMSPTLVLWRNQFSDDPKIGRVALSVSKRNRLAVSHPDYAAREIDCLLRFLRSSMDRFLLIYKGIFANQAEMIKYYEETFPHIMYEFYKAAKAAEDQRIL